MKKLLAFFSVLAIAVAFSSCEESDGCVTCVSMNDPNIAAQTYCEADGDYNGLSEGAFVDFQFASGFECN